MKGDFSRRTFNKGKNYNAVLNQQGRVSLDSDFNEQAEILECQRRMRTVDIIGTCCAPQNEGGFRIRHPGNGLNDLLISTGRIYAGGHLCELHPENKIMVSFPNGTTDKVKVEKLKVDGEVFSAGQWVVIFTEEDPEGILASIDIINTDNNILTLNKDISALHNGTNPMLQRMILYSEQKDFPDAPAWVPASGQIDLVYLDVWNRHVTAIEDPELLEAALGGPDTTTRIRTICQVKILTNVKAADCFDKISEWEEETSLSGGRLTAQTKLGTDPKDPCLIAEGGGYKGLENRLYRVEIHDPGEVGTATFKWSRDNGSIAYAVQEFIPDDTDPAKVYKVKLKQIGRDKILKIKVNDWLEVCGDKTDLDCKKAGVIAQVTHMDEAQRILTLSKDISVHKSEDHPKVRRWDSGIETLSPPSDTGTDLIELEDGVQVKFSGSNFKVGDYWIFAARTVTGKIEELNDEPPMGIKHDYCRLALIDWNADGTAEINDCRNEFLSLCELSKIKPGSKNNGCCTVTVGEGGDFNDIQQAVNAIKAGPGTICILPGVYSISEPIRIAGRDITIKGCGGKSIIWNESETPVFEISNSRGITISDLWAATRGARVIHTINSLYIIIEDCMLLAIGISDVPGAIVFQGFSLESEIRNSLIGGIVGILFEPSAESRININASVRIDNNTIFALQSAIMQLSGSTFLDCDISNNILLGFAIGSLMKIFFPPQFLEYAGEKEMYDKEKIDEARKVKRDLGGIETVTKSNIEPVYIFADYLKTEASSVKVSSAYLAAEVQIVTSSPVIDFQAGAIDANFVDNIIIGKTGIHSGSLMESAVEKNIIAALLNGIELGPFEGLTINDNLITSGLCGIISSGILAFNLSAVNNRIISGSDGIAYLEPGQQAKYQFIVNNQLSQNFITAAKSGIKILNIAVFIYDFTAYDNSIMDCSDYGIILLGLDENQFLAEDNVSYQRVVQRNSVQVKGSGIVVGISDSKILDNDITISYNHESQKTNLSYGISILASKCTAVNNSVQGNVNIEKNILSKGGIIIHMQPSEYYTADTTVRSNRIYGGIGNGIEIASEINNLVRRNTVTENLVIESNLIHNMGLNGIAVQEGMLITNNLSITNNKIWHCNNQAGNNASWWKYAGIVLNSGEKIQITGNEIWENGINTGDRKIQTGGIYAEQVRDMIIADNQFINNGNQKFPASQAVIHIPAKPNEGNENIKITDNLIKGSNAPALFLGGEYSSDIFNDKKIFFGLDRKTVITGNHFESMIEGPAVDLQCSRTVFSNNYIECLITEKQNYAVDLGYGWYVTAVGNISSGEILYAGLFVVKELNVIFS